MERSRLLRGPPGSLRAGSMCVVKLVSSVLTGGGPDLAANFRLLLLCLILEGEEAERFDADGLSDLGKGHFHSHDESYCKGIRFWDSIWVLLEKEANDLSILQVRL
jgi:hypothetical protein